MQIMSMWTRSSRRISAAPRTRASAFKRLNGAAVGRFLTWPRVFPRMGLDHLLEPRWSRF